MSCDTYDLDPFHLCSGPGLSLVATFKKLKIGLKLVLDIYAVDG